MCARVFFRNSSWIIFLYLLVGSSKDRSGIRHRRQYAGRGRAEHRGWYFWSESRRRRPTIGRGRFRQPAGPLFHQRIPEEAQTGYVTESPVRSSTAQRLWTRKTFPVHEQSVQVRWSDFNQEQIGLHPGYLIPSIHTFKHFFVFFVFLYSPDLQNRLFSLFLFLKLFLTVFLMRKVRLALIFLFTFVLFFCSVEVDSLFEGVDFFANIIPARLEELCGDLFRTTVGMQKLMLFMIRSGIFWWIFFHAS